VREKKEDFMCKKALINVVVLLLLSLVSLQGSMAQDSKNVLHLSCDYAFESKWVNYPQDKDKLLQPADAETHHVYIDLAAKTASFDEISSLPVAINNNTYTMDEGGPLDKENHQISIDRRSGFLSIMVTQVVNGQVVVRNEAFGICGAQTPKF
jgi:hypothetical protein